MNTSSEVKERDLRVISKGEKRARKQRHDDDDLKKKKRARRSNLGDDDNFNAYDDRGRRRTVTQSASCLEAVHFGSSSPSEEESLSDQSANVSHDEDGETRMSIRHHVKAHYGAVKIEHHLLKKFVHWQVEAAGNIKNATDANNSATHVGRFVKFLTEKPKVRKRKGRWSKRLRTRNQS